MIRYGQIISEIDNLRIVLAAGFAGVVMLALNVNTFSRTMAKSTFLIVVLLVTFLSTTYCGDTSEEEEDGPAQKWKKKDVRDYNDADLERLFDQWEVRTRPCCLPRRPRAPCLSRSDMRLDPAGRANAVGLCSLYLYFFLRSGKNAVLSLLSSQASILYLKKSVRF